MLRLNRAHQIWIYVTVFTLVATGVVWLIDHYCPNSVDNTATLSSTVGPIALKIHGAAAMVFLVLLGTLILNHMWVGLKADRNKISGVFLALLNLWLVVTGYALYYASSESLRNGASISHSIVGLLVPILLLVHQKRFFRKKTGKNGT